MTQCKISFLATPATSSNLRNQAPLFMELRLLQGILYNYDYRWRLLLKQFIR